MDTAEFMAKAGKSALIRKKLEERIDEMQGVLDTIEFATEHYHYALQCLGGNGHTVGCSCLECQAEEYLLTIRAALAVPT